MSVRRLVQAEINGSDAIQGSLSQETIPVDVVNKEIMDLVEDLRDTMWHYEICVGLAAPQIGSKYRVAVANPTRSSRDDDLILINPTIESATGKKEFKRESCMSAWGLQGEVERRKKIQFEYTTLLGSRVTATFEGFPARVVQHEVDHLDGLLYISRLRPGAKLEKADHYPERPDGELE